MAAGGGGRRGGRGGGGRGGRWGGDSDGGGGEGNETPLGDAPAASAAAATAAPADAPTLAGWMSPADADRHREALMEERAVRVGLESAAYEEAFSLCEH